MGNVLRDVIRTFAADDWAGLSASKARLLCVVPAAGASVTELAERLWMTKQGCGQLVSQLVRSGHLVTGVGDKDRRVRLVRRTPLGDEAVAVVHARLQTVEARWRVEVGEERYVVFRSVLEQLAGRE